MILTISNALLNITVTLLLGSIAGWHRDFDGKQATTLNWMVMLYALPLSVADAQAASAPLSLPSPRKSDLTAVTWNHTKS
jgi:hypothetical protein